MGDHIVTLAATVFGVVIPIAFLLFMWFSL